MSRSVWSRVSTIIGIAGIVVFAVIYGAELLPRHGPPVTIQWLRDHFGRAGLIAVNIIVVLAFLALLPYRRPTKARWKTHSAFIAFVIALMTEMFGWPLVIFLLSPIVDVPSLSPWMREHFGHTASTVGTIVSLAGVVLIAAGWVQIHRAEGLVQTGLYRYIRHPQYTGIFLFTLGWILHWPSVITLIIWPVLLAAYVWLSRFEERMAIDQFGDAYQEYMARTKRFIPWVV
jgi:protein-S-isoprenylcysteine O-methyltransferase Ste14